MKSSLSVRPFGALVALSGCIALMSCSGSVSRRAGPATGEDPADESSNSEDPTSSTESATENPSEQNPTVGSGARTDLLCFEPGTTIAPAQEMPPSFVGNCAGCHGADGLGRGLFPSLAKADLNKWESVVRTGVTGKMPSYSAEVFSEGDLAQTFSNVRGIELEARPQDSCALKPGLRPSAEIEAAYNHGLEIWRKPDSHGAACANCHAPDGLDLAVTAVRSSDIVRRSLLHLDVDDAVALAAFIDAVRVRLNLPPGDKLPGEIRPMQPGGEPLKCSDYTDCDHAFGLEMAALSPTLAGDPIVDAQSAKSARDELSSKNFRTMKIGLALNRQSGDAFHGESMRTVNDWYPDFHKQPTDRAARDKIYAAHDAYLADPNWDSLFAMIEVIDDNSNRAEAGEVFDGVINNMHAGVLIYQHILRLEQVLGGSFADEPSTIYGTRNFLWDTGDGARVVMGNTWKTGYIPPELREKMGADRSYAELGTGSYGNEEGGDPEQVVLEELAGIRVSWFFAGMQMDAGLYGGKTNSTKSSEYFTGSLYGRNLVNHSIWLRFRKNLALAYEQSRMAERPDWDKTHIATNAANNFAYFLGYGRGLTSRLPPEGEMRDLYFRLAGNAIRMQGHLLLDEIKETGQVRGKDNVLKRWQEDSGSMKAMLTNTATGSVGDKDNQLFLDLADAINSACEADALGYKQEPYPGHCSHSGN